MIETSAKRATVYFEPALHQAIRLKAAHTHRSISEIVNDAVRFALREDQEDLAAFDKRVAEPVMSYEALLKDLKANGKRILERIRTLAVDPRPAGCEKLSGQERYRIRQGDYRIIYEVEDARLIVLVVKVGHRREIYRKL